MYTARLVSAPTVEPVSLNEAKVHLRIDPNFSADDSYITNLIKAVRQKLEDYCSRAFVTQTWKLTLDQFPNRHFIELPMAGPLQSVSEIAYKLSDGTSQIFNIEKTVADTEALPGRLILKPGSSWPGDSLFPGSAVSITYTCGFSASPLAVPQSFVQAMLLMIGYLYESRQGEAPSAKYQSMVAGDLPSAVRSLLYTHRIASPCPYLRVE